MTKICKITRELEKVLKWGEGSHMARTSLYASMHPEVTSYFWKRTLDVQSTYLCLCLIETGSSHTRPS